MKKRFGMVFNAITFLCISLICVIGLGFGLRSSGVTGENFVTKLFTMEGTTTTDPYLKGPERSKKYTPNGDGSYKLELTVKGESVKKVNKTNVVVVFDTSNSMDTSTGNKENRLTAAKRAVNSVAQALLSHNGKNGNPNDVVEMALIDFNTTATTRVTKTTSYETYSAAVNALKMHQGTNWEAGLRAADAIDFGDKDQVYVIFVSDGNPSVRLSAMNYTSDYHSDTKTYYNFNNSGNEQRAYDASVDEAKSIVDNGKKFYTIGVYGNVSRLEALTKAAGAPAGNYYSADNTSALQEALNKILAEIEMAGIGAVTIDDGTTANVVASSDVAYNLLTIDKDSFEYYKDDKEWKEAPKATIKDGHVIWDLGNGVLDNGVVYKVTFDVWPSQYTLDLIADLKNGSVKYDSLDAAVKEYLAYNKETGEYDLATNTEAIIKYTDTRTTDGPQTGMFRNPPKVETETYKMNVEKLWKNGVDTKLIPNIGIQLSVLKDGDAVPNTGVSVSANSSWKGKIDIAIGMLKYNKQTGSVKLMEKGHEYTLAEPKGLSYHWELESKTVRPMLVNNKVKVLVKDEKVSFAEDYKVVDGKEYFKIDGKFYYIDEELNQLTATNYRRSNLNLSKVVTGDNAPEDALFTYDLTVTNSMADLTTNSVPDDDDDEIWFSVCDSKQFDCDNTDPETYKPVFDIETTAEAEVKDGKETGYYKFTSGKTITVALKAGWNLRITNLPTGSTYSINETTMPTGFEFDSVVSDGTKDGRVVSGEIKEYNKKYNNVYTNKYVFRDVVVTKTWDDGNDQDGIRPPELALVLKADNEEVKAEPVVTKAGNTWTYTYKGLPTDKTYTVEEPNVPRGYDRSINGLIVTNTHEVATAAVVATKVWHDDNDRDGLRPSELALVLKADGEVVDATPVVNKSGNTWTYTYPKLAVNKAGKPIIYTIEEADENVPTGYRKTKQEGLTVENTHEIATVSKSVLKTWNDGNDRDGKRPTSVTVTLLADGEVVKETVNGEEKNVTFVLNKDNEWTATKNNLPKNKRVVEDNVVSSKTINYTWREELSREAVANGYELTGNALDNDNNSLTVLTNTRILKTSFSVSKEWDDDDDRDGKRPTDVTVNLLADGNVVKDENGEPVIATLSDQNKWGYTFEELPEFRNNDLKEPIVYTVVEQDTGVDGYSDTYRTCSEAEASEGKCVKGTYIVTNTYDPEKTTVTVVKSWDDADDQDGIRPDTVTVKLIADGEDVLDADGKNVTIELTKDKGWTKTFSGLNKYKDGGEEIVYSVEEINVKDGYKASTSKTTCEEDSEEECIAGVNIITNKHEVETVDILGEVFWDDADDQDGVRPEDVTICVYANGQEVDCTTVTPKDDEWKYEFEDLPKNENGEEIEYTVSEKDIDSYEITPDGYNFTNKHVPDEGEVLGENEEFPDEGEVAGEKEEQAKEKDNDNPETGDTILPYALLLLTSLGGISITAKKIVDRIK